MTESDYIHMIVAELNHIADRIDALEKKTGQMLERLERKKQQDMSEIWNKKLIDSTELCRILHISTRTLHRLKKVGLPYFRLSSKIHYFRISDVMGFMEANPKPGK